MQHVFIVGSKGIPGAYGGYETFVDKLTQYHQDHPKLRYHVACKGGPPGEFSYHGARCFRVPVPKLGAASAIWYDVAALELCCRTIRREKLPHPIVYILACRIGPFLAGFQRRLHAMGGQIYLNPDGHEWLRAKWPPPVRLYWKLSERMMAKHADLLICDSRAIECYMQQTYAACRLRTTFIAYGAECRRSALADDAPRLLDWYRQNGLAPKEYYLVVGRFVPENNFETMLREFMRSGTRRSLALITTADPRFLRRLEQKLLFGADPRIKFVGAVYDEELLRKIRENAYGYLHGHEVGGTNPSLLEALSSTGLNLALDVSFNREVCEDAALYWTKEEGSLSGLIDRAEQLPDQTLRRLERRAKERVARNYSWQKIARQYEYVFWGR